MTKALKKFFPVFAGPTLLAFMIAFIVPFFMGLYLSFTKFSTLTNARFVGTDNYARGGDGEMSRRRDARWSSTLGGGLERL